jgi:hypothetical protein
MFWRNVSAFGVGFNVSFICLFLLICKGISYSFSLLESIRHCVYLSFIFTSQALGSSLGIYLMLEDVWFFALCFSTLKHQPLMWKLVALWPPLTWLGSMDYSQGKNTIVTLLWLMHNDIDPFLHQPLLYPWTS